MQAPMLFSSFPIIRLRPIILLLGDSLTQQGFGPNDGWASLLANAYSRRADVLNRGYSGYTTRHFVSTTTNVLSNTSFEQVLFCTLFLGTNDAAPPGERQHVSLDEYESNLKRIVTQVRANTRQDLPMYLLTPPPVDTTRWKKNQSNINVSTYKHNDVVQQYGNAVQRVAFECGNCIVVDVFDKMGGSNDDVTTFAPYLRDGLHLSNLGNKLVFDALLETLQETDVGPEQVAMDFYSSQTVPTATTTRPSIVLLGDSFTQFGFLQGGWVARLCEDYARRADIFNRGFQGYTTRDLLEILPQVLYKQVAGATLFVTLWLGGNDAITDERHVPLDEFERNLVDIIERIRQAILPTRTLQGERLELLPIILITPPPVDDSIASEYLTSQTTLAYANRVQTVASLCDGCECINLFDVFAANDDYVWTDDGVHLNKRGNVLVYLALMDLIRDKCPQLAPMMIALDGPLWHESC